MKNIMKEKAYYQLVGYFFEDLYMVGIKPTSNLKEYIVLNILDYNEANYSKKTDNGDGNDLFEFDNGYGFWMVRPENSQLYYSTTKSEYMTDKISNGGSLVQLLIHNDTKTYTDKPGFNEPFYASDECYYEKEFINSHIGYMENYNPVARRIETSVYTNTIKLFEETDKHYGVKLSNHYFSMLGLAIAHQPDYIINAYEYGNYFFINEINQQSGKNIIEPIQVRKSEGKTLYSIYHDYMIRRGYIKENNIEEDNINEHITPLNHKRKKG